MDESVSLKRRLCEPAHLEAMIISTFKTRLSPSLPLCSSDVFSVYRRRRRVWVQDSQAGSG